MPDSVHSVVNLQLKKNTFTNRLGPNADHPRYHRLSTAVPSSETKEVPDSIRLVFLLQSVEVSVISFLPHSFVRAWGTTVIFISLLSPSFLVALEPFSLSTTRLDASLGSNGDASTRDMPDCLMHALFRCSIACFGNSHVVTRKGSKATTPMTNFENCFG